MCWGVSSPQRGLSPRRGRCSSRSHAGAALERIIQGTKSNTTRRSLFNGDGLSPGDSLRIGIDWGTTECKKDSGRGWHRCSLSQARACAAHTIVDCGLPDQEAKHSQSKKRKTRQRRAGCDHLIGRVVGVTASRNTWPKEGSHNDLRCWRGLSEEEFSGEWSAKESGQQSRLETRTKESYLYARIREKE